MSLCDEQHEKFGCSCKWLGCDDYFHMTKCDLNRARREALYEKFEELGISHPEFSHEVFSDSCYLCHSDYSCFVKKDNKTDYSSLDDDFLSGIEKEALEIARNELKNKDEEYFKTTYLEGKRKYIERKRQRLEEEFKKLSDIEKENDFSEEKSI